MAELDYINLRGLAPSVPSAYVDGYTIFEQVAYIGRKINEMIDEINQKFSKEEGKTLIAKEVGELIEQGLADLQIDGVVTNVKTEFAVVKRGVDPAESYFTEEKPKTWDHSQDIYVRYVFYNDEEKLGSTKAENLATLVGQDRDADTLQGKTAEYFASKKDLASYETIENAENKFATKKQLSDVIAGLDPEEIDATELTRKEEAVRDIALEVQATGLEETPSAGDWSETLADVSKDQLVWLRLKYTMANNAEYFSNATCEYSKQIRTLLNVISTDAESLGGVPAEKYELKERTKSTVTGVVMQFGYSALEDSPPSSWSETRTNLLGTYADANNFLKLDGSIIDGFVKLTYDQRFAFYDMSKTDLKPDTLYTIKMFVKKNTLDVPTYVNGQLKDISAFDTDWTIPASFIGEQVFTGITKEDLSLSSVAIRTFVEEGGTTGEIEFRIMLLEGDWSNKEESPHLWQRLKLTHLDGSNTYTTATRMPKPEELDTTQFATAVQGALAESALQRSEYTASDVFTKVKSQDGAGSGLDADKLDGKHASEFATATQGTNADNALPKSMFTSQNILDKLKSIDGHDSELDADKLDGLHSTSFVNTVSRKQYLGMEPIVKGTGAYTSKMTIEDSNARELGEFSFKGTSNLNIIAKQGIMNLDTPNKSGGLRHNKYRVPTVSWGSTVPSDLPPGHIFIKI